MTLFSAQELLRQHGIAYIATQKSSYTTNCPKCGQGYCTVRIDNKGVRWFCHDCEHGGGEFFEQRSNGRDRDEPKRVYDYTDEDGNRLYQSLRFEPVGKPKYFRQRISPEQKKWSIKGVRLVPYHLPQLQEAVDNDKVVFVVEGEKDVETLERHGFAATCCAMGAGKWRELYNEHFTGADVVVCGDNDEPGRRHVAQVAKHLITVARCVRILDLKTIWPEIEESDDISDWFERKSYEKRGNADVLADVIGVLNPVGEADFVDTDGTDAKPPWEDDEPDAAVEPIRILSKAEFIATFEAPYYLVDGIFQRSFVYALTGPTSHAKSAIALLLAQLVSSPDRNAMFGTHHVKKGRVLYLVGENPLDICMRVIGADSCRLDDPAQDQIFWISGRVEIAERFNEIAAAVEAIGGVNLVIVDTSAAYFLGDDEISNSQMGAHARMLRRLTTLPGKPCVLTLCHPIKHAQDPTQLLPRGGGAFLAEMDGNLTVWKRDDMVELHYTKMRGPSFEPIIFKLESIKTTKLVDGDGNILPTVRAIAVSRSEEESQPDRLKEDEDQYLAAILSTTGKHTDAAIAEVLGWTNDKGEAIRSRVQRARERIEKAKPMLMKKNRDRWELTEEGKKIAVACALRNQKRADEEAQNELRF